MEIEAREDVPDTGSTERLPSVPSEIDPTTPGQQWNRPRFNIFRVGASFWSFMVMGSNDAAYGALIPYLEEYYNISYMVVSCVFLSPLVGYVIAALVNNKLHETIGQRGISLIVPPFRLVAYILSCVHPPYPVLVVAYIFAGVANGLAEALLNTYIGNMQNSNEMLGLLHGVYGAGAVISPLIATNLITQADAPWYYFYFFMIGISAIEAVAFPLSFWKFTGPAFRKAHADSSDDSNGAGLTDALFKRPAARVSWICALLLLLYVGVEVSIGGWIVTIMRDVRKAEPFPSGMTSMGFWLGITAGRMMLGFVTGRLGERLATPIYIFCSIVFSLILWLVPNFYASAVAVSIEGFFLGPLFPAVVVVMTKLLPKHLHVTSIGFVAAFGGAGAAVLPFVAGGIAQGSGVKSLLPFIFAVSVGILILWMGLPRARSRS